MNHFLQVNFAERIIYTMFLLDLSALCINGLSENAQRFIRSQIHKYPSCTIVGNVFFSMASQYWHFWTSLSDNFTVTNVNIGSPLLAHASSSLQYLLPAVEALKHGSAIIQFRLGKCFLAACCDCSTRIGHRSTLGYFVIYVVYFSKGLYYQI